MKDFVTITSKGQLTLPAHIRRELGITKPGQKLQIYFDDQNKRVELRKPAQLATIQALVQKHAQSSAPVPEDIHEWYQKERTKDLAKRDVL